MERIEIGDFLLIAQLHTGMDAKLLASFPRVLNLGEAALAAPFAGFGDYEAFPALHQKAGVYCSRILAYHPLPNGNKRTGYDVMREFLHRNGATFTHPRRGGLKATAGVIEDLAAGTLEEARFLDWVGRRIG